MSITPARILVAVEPTLAYLKVIGWANAAASVHFKSILNHLKEKAVSSFVLDLTDCMMMDSTFLGILAGFCLRLSQTVPGAPPLRLLNPNSRIMDLLDNMGVSYLFQMVQDAPPLAEYTARETQTPGMLQVAETSLEAHRTLMSLNPQNIIKLKDVVAYLEEELESAKGGNLPSDGSLKG